MTKEEFVASILAKRAEKELNDYVEGVLEGISEKDLNGKIGEEDEIFDFRVTDKT
jgi:DNA invertase Pin-like site-specific DNA recombinase